MKAAIFNGKGDVKLGDRPNPEIRLQTDAIVRVVRSCVCGSDLWYYRGLSPHASGPIGHEFIGIVNEIGENVKNLEKGDFVISPFTFNDGSCPNCLRGWTGNCEHGGSFGNNEIDGGQGEFVRVPFADTTLVKVNGKDFSEEKLKSLLTLSDVLCTGYHAAVSANVTKGSTVVIVGDGAVGLCGVISSKRLGANRIIVMSRNPSRQRVAKDFGATDIIEERGPEAVKKVMEFTQGEGADATLECVGTYDSMNAAFGSARVGSIVGSVGVPHGVEVPIKNVIFKNVGLRGGIAPVRHYIPKLIDDVINGKINSGKVFDFQTDLNGIEEAYKVMDERKAIKSYIIVSDLQQ